MNQCGTGKSGCVAYQIQPVKPGCKSCIIHISLNETSRFTLALIDDAHSIIKSGEEAKFDIKMLTTDAPTTKRIQMHTDFFDFLHKTPGTFEQKLEKMKEYGKEFPESDFLHLFIAMQRKINNNSIRMTNFCPLIRLFNEIPILKNSTYYTDDIKLNTSLSQMKDDLALLVFNHITYISLVLMVIISFSLFNLCLFFF